MRWLVCALALLSSPFLAEAQCGDRSPAYPVPETVFSASGFTFLWPSRLRPAVPGERLPADRDSTDRVAGTTVPGSRSGHELFKSADAVDTRYLFVAYNAGLQVWDLADPARPRRVAFRDGWEGQFLSFPPVSEQLTFVEDLSVLRLGDGRYLAAVSGKHPVGPSLWVFDPEAGSLAAVYQDSGTVSRQVSLERLADRMVLISGTDEADGGLAVYDAGAALERYGLTGVGCLDSGPVSGCGARLGEIAAGHPMAYLDTFTAEGVVYIATSGLFWPLELWALRSADAPGTAENVLAPVAWGSAGVAAFEAGGAYYLAATQADALRVYEVTACLSGSCRGELRSAYPIARGSAIGGPLTYSQSGSQHYLYAGVELPGGEGSQVEYLLEAEGLDGAIPHGITLSGITGDGGVYVDGCTGDLAGYWSYLYPANSSGLRDLRPRSGVFAGRYFYRAAQTVLDVHERIEVAAPVAEIRVTPDPPFAGELVRFEAVSDGASSWAWSFEDGEPASASAREAEVLFTSTGAKTVRVEACNVSGCDVAVRVLDVTGRAPEILSITVQEVQEVVP